MNTFDLQAAIAQSRDPWVVLLCPTLEARDEARRILSLFTPSGVPFSGRTAVFPSQKITVAAAQEDVFLPTDAVFSIVMLAWGSTPLEEAERWLKRGRSGL